MIGNFDVVDFLQTLTDRCVELPGADASGLATHALPNRLRGRVIGALNMFNDHSVQLSDSDLAVGQAMADVATIGLLHQRNTHEQTILSEQLQTALQSRILIEQAKALSLPNRSQRQQSVS